jgi:hypothetical protein
MCAMAPYDVVLSFAGEDREYVDKVAAALVSSGIRVFYDKYEEVELWGKDLYQHLSEVYRTGGKYCVIFASKAYAEKLWAKHELRSAQARAFEENREYILPARFDDTEIPGILATTAYLDLRGRSPENLASAIEKKVRPVIPPPQPVAPITVRHAPASSQPSQRFARRTGEPARPWNDPTVPEHEKLARGKVTNITDALFAGDSIEVVMADTDILQIDYEGRSYYFQCSNTYQTLTGYFYWDGSDRVQGVGNPDGSMWPDSEFQIGIFGTEYGKYRGAPIRVRLTRKFERMSPKFHPR